MVQIKNSLILLLAAVIWGVAFVAQSAGMEYVGGFTFNCVRSLIGGAVLLPCIFLLRRLQGKQEGGQGAAAGQTGHEQARHTGAALTLRGGRLLRDTALYRLQPTAAWHQVYYRGKGRIYHGALYCAGACIRAVSPQEDWETGMAWTWSCGGGAVFSMY